MRIVLITRCLDIGGAERQICLLANELQRRGNEVRLVTFYDGGQLRDQVSPDVDLVQLSKSGRWDLVGFWWRLNKVISSFCPEVLYSFLPVPNIIASLVGQLHNIPVVWGVRASNMDLSKYDWLSRATTQLARHLARFSAAIIVNSESGRIFHGEIGYPQRKMKVVPNGIEASAWLPDPRAGSEFRSLHLIPATATVIGVVGRLDPMKDHQTFIDAAAKLSPASEDICFVCVGSGDPAYEEELRQYAEKKGVSDYFLWIPATGDLRGAYNGIDVLVLSSYGEGFPNVVGEAMACGTPCVGTDVGDVKAVVGSVGKVVPPKDPDALAHACRDMVNNARSGLIDPSAVRAQIEQNFSVEVMARRTEKVLEGVRRC